ncbi:shikimate kinase [Anaerocolumna sedimenticola]|uniref:Shikimate kinase n=1 Tax=Anaerocolumna sedimenticola TaxID=2696063 RepID=A0A6P1TKU9_9FIRM|nr:shikimate kinase [Anaerocolumna sedimenticola]QHQ61684.1 shikimate kinase [Anaerocolumna sedimenticola]
MSRGIIIFGSPGSGTTSLGRKVAKQLGFQHFDLDDYLWRWDTPIPFTVTRPREERIKLLLDDISKFSHFVMSGSMDSYNAPFVPLFDLAVLVSAPVKTRVERVKARELARFGERMLPGGDMFETHKNFLDGVRRYDTDGSPCRRVHEQWASTLPCPVLYMDGTVTIEENAGHIVEQYSSMSLSNLTMAQDE